MVYKTKNNIKIFKRNIKIYVVNYVDFFRCFATYCFTACYGEIILNMVGRLLYFPDYSSPVACNMVTGIYHHLVAGY